MQMTGVSPNWSEDSVTLPLLSSRACQHLAHLPATHGMKAVGSILAFLQTGWKSLSSTAENLHAGSAGSSKRQILCHMQFRNDSVWTANHRFVTTMKLAIKGMHKFVAEHASSFRSLIICFLRDVCFVHVCVCMCAFPEGHTDWKKKRSIKPPKETTWWNHIHSRVQSPL